MYVITGATGNIGRRIVEGLLESGLKVRAIGRNQRKLQTLVNKGAEGLLGDLHDVNFLSQAFTGATAVFAMIPPNYQAENVRAYQNEIGNAIVSALTRANVSYVVNLSSLGAHLPEKTGPILGLYDLEQRLNKVPGLNVVHLRPTYFMENLLPNIDLIKNQGINGAPLRADLKFPAIATSDIARVAVSYLKDLAFVGSCEHELLGQRDLTMNEITKIIGEAIGKSDLQYVQFPYEDAQKAMVQMGLSHDMARSLIELNQSMNEGFVISETARSPEKTTETSFEEFAKTFAAYYNS